MPWLCGSGLQPAVLRSTSFGLLLLPCPVRFLECSRQQCGLLPCFTWSPVESLFVTASRWVTHADLENSLWSPGCPQLTAILLAPPSPAVEWICLNFHKALGPWTLASCLALGTLSHGDLESERDPDHRGLTSVLSLCSLCPRGLTYPRTYMAEGLGLSVLVSTVGSGQW